MKRQLIFDVEDGYYVLKESGKVIFAIDCKELEFDSLYFYNGVYKDKSAAIELTNAICTDEFKKGRYIFDWLMEIVSSVQAVLNDPEDDIDLEQSPVRTKKIVCLYELSACAGNGFYSEGPSRADREIETDDLDADYAVMISGSSMEPTILDQSIVSVKKVEELNNGDIGIFLVDGELMCKRFRQEGQERWLQPDNNSGEFNSVILGNNVNCIIQGKVLI